MPYLQRKHPRLKAFDYASGGVFFVTVCAAEKKKIFGSIAGGEEAVLKLNALGQLAYENMRKIPEIYPGVVLLAGVVMPNHIHLLLQIPNDTPVSLFTVVRSFKAATTKQWGHPVWQSSFYEHVARNERDTLRCWKYIEENPKKWALDEYFA